MMTPKQREELRQCASLQGYRVAGRGPKIMVTSKCMTLHFDNNDAGYAAAFAWLNTQATRGAQRKT